ncbi:di-heme oxidoreductase family protein [Yoonia sp. MH D7]
MKNPVASLFSRPGVLLISVLGVAVYAISGQAQTGADLTITTLSAVPRTAAEVARVASVTALTSDFTKAEPFEANGGGGTTVRARDNADAFSLVSANASFERELQFTLGNGFFTKLWVSSPSSTLASDGLGPLFNARACQSCHIKDGRGHPPETDTDNAVSIFLRISVPVAGTQDMSEIEAYLHSIDADTKRTAPHPIYGEQMQDTGVLGHAAEYTFDVDYAEISVPLSGGETATLRKPTYTAANLGYGPLGDGAMLSPRVTQQMIGLGLLEAIPAADILAQEDPDDADGDGISGRAQFVWSAEADQIMLGRFGHKAGRPSVREQSAAAFLGDIGISTPIFPAPSGDCTIAQTNCMTAPNGTTGGDEATEIGTEGLDLVTFYARNLAVPERRNVDDPQVLRGKQVFYQTGCTSCHTPKYVTDRLIDQPEQSFQLIWPHTDLLLHDMGEGLADNRPEGLANGREWRTPPLWGIGMTETVSGHTYFLHDGRARSLLEAVLWHGGEAQNARDTFVDMPAEDRAALITYLESL